MEPHLTILLHEGPIGPPPDWPAEEGAFGALVEFRGLVRGEEDGLPIVALQYQAYPGMAEREMERIARELLGPFPCQHVYIAHRSGLVPVGAAAIIVRATARHRGAAFSFVAAFMDRLKADVPIWKVQALPAPPVAP